VLYTYMVQAGVMTMEKLVETMCVNPRKRFGIPQGNDFAIWDLGEVYTVDPETFVTMGRATPFAGHTLRGKCLLTVVDGEVVYKA
jgi:dihydroorotase